MCVSNFCLTYGLIFYICMHLQCTNGKCDNCCSSTVVIFSHFRGSFLYSGSFKHLVDIGFICAMGPPGGGRNPITPRLSRHFNFLSFTEMEDASKFKIFSTILKSWMHSFSDAETLVPKIVNSTITVYQTITTEVS